MRSITVIIILFLNYFGFSQMAFQNKTTVPLKVAFGYYTESAEYTGWTTKGWYTVNPGDKLQVMDKPLDNEYYYYYASSADTAIEFRGSILLKVADGTFKIDHANEEISIKRDKHRFFKQVDTGERKNYLVVLHEKYAEEH